MGTKSVLIQLTGHDLETLIFDCVDRALKLNQVSQILPPDIEPFGDFNWLRGICAGIPTSTLRIKSAAGEIPGTKKFGKRVLYDKAVVLNWIRNQDQQPKPDTASIEQAAQAQVNDRLSFQTRNRKSVVTSTPKAA